MHKAFQYSSMYHEMSHDMFKLNTKLKIEHGGKLNPEYGRLNLLAGIVSGAYCLFVELHHRKWGKDNWFEAIDRVFSLQTRFERKT